METRSCPQCGGSDFDRRGMTLFCKYCETELVIEHDDTLAWVCGDCGFKNPENSVFCGKCGEPLKSICYECHKLVRGDLQFCPTCRFEFLPDEKLLFTHQDNKYANYLSNKRLFCRSLSGKGSRQLLLEQIQEIVIIKVYNVGYAIGIKGFTGEFYKLEDGEVYDGSDAFTQINVPTKQDAELFARTIVENAPDNPPIVSRPKLRCFERMYATAIAVVAVITALISLLT